MYKIFFKSNFVLLVLLLSGCRDSEPTTVRHVAADQSYYEVYAVVNDSLKHGRYEKFSKDGTRQMTANYNMGLLDGVSLTYAPEGYIERLETYSDGKAHGELLLYYANDTTKLR